MAHYFLIKISELIFFFIILLLTYIKNPLQLFHFDSKLSFYMKKWQINFTVAAINSHCVKRTCCDVMRDSQNKLKKKTE